MARIFSEAVAGFRRAPLLTGLSVLMVALAFLVLALFGLVAHNLQAAVSQLEERVEVVVYLREDARPAEVSAALEALRTMPGVEGVRHVTKDEALERALRELPEIAEVSSDLEVNPFPASLEVRFQAGRRDTETVKRVAEAAASLPGVEEVRYGREWVERLFFLRRVAGLAALVLGVSFGAVAALIMATAIRLAVLARRDEIYVMQLVGARDAYIRSPFLLEGVVVGTAGALLALGLSWGLYVGLSRFLFRLEWLPAVWSLGGVLAGALFGLLASALALQRQLRRL